MQKSLNQAPSPKSDNYDTVFKQGKNVFKLEDQTQRALANLLYGQLLNTRKTSVLKNAISIDKFCLFPTVHAAAAKEPPKRPPPMKFEDLPIYEGPHYEYKDYIADKRKCPKADVKILQTALYPSVCKYRKQIKNSVGGMVHELCTIKKELCGSFCKNKKKFIDYMRHPQNEAVRKGVVALGTATGMYLGSGTRGFTRKLFCGAIGALAAGALCFPKETDEIFRDVSYSVAKFAIFLYNAALTRNFSLRERLPCQVDKPAPPPPRPADRSNKQCQQKK